METDVQTNDKDFVEQALKFYKNVDGYSSLLDLDRKELDAFKNDIKVFLFIADKHYRSFTESFVRYNITILRNRLQHLFVDCVASKHYTKRIGEKLGIVSTQHRFTWPLGWASREISLEKLVGIDFK